MKLLSIIVLLFLLFSCNKSENNVKQLSISAMTVVNAVVNAGPLISDITGADSVASYYSAARQISYGTFFENSIPSASTVPVVIYQLSDTTHALFNAKLNLQPNSIYSLFLSGTLNGQNSPDSLLTVDHPPYHPPTDSSSGIRFVNLSPGSSPISVNIQGNPSASEVSTLSYRNITGFKNYPATTNITQYTFEIRDAASGNLLTAYTYNIAPYQNITIAVIGSKDPNVGVPITTIQVNNF
jgi:hypothetical protein